MKSILMVLAAMMVLASDALAATKSTVYCKDNGRVLDAQSEDGGFFDCAGALMDGEACFTGNRKDVIDLINSDYFNWDEQWLAVAHFMGRDSIAYLYVDGPNEIQHKVSMSRCTKAFFR